IATPADCIVGAWHLDIDTQRKDGNDSICYTLPTPLYILFNPWCKVDQVYMEDEDCRKEYILSDSGLIWQGTSSSLKQMAWNFSQFEELVLDCALYVINKVGRVPVHQRRDPVKIVRAISAAVNAQDDNGILVGNWTGDFVGGTPPTGWNGSMRILQKYFRTKEPVKFGQCWVFAGVTTTICRALGIPSRVITNFDSAHDTTASITVDVFVDGEGNPIKELCKDSVWNFHVWNEVWMERPDIGNGYGGWQVIDATPQERSADNSMFCCGPASVTAIRRGEVLKPYDGEFVFAMANADQVFWRYNENDTKMKLLGQDIDKIGQNISTKEVGRFERLDITQEYKPDDGSVEERKAVARALRTATNDKSRYYYNKAFYDVNFEISRIDNVVIGKPLRVLFTVVNKHETNSSDIVATLSLYSVLYTGIPSRLVKKETFSHTINPFSKMELGFDVTYEEYADALTDQGLFKISLMGKVPNIDYEMFSQSDVRVRKPDVNFNGRALCQVNSHLVLEVSLENPLPVPLTKPRFSVEGPGMGPAQKIKLDDVIPVNGIAKGVVTLIPRTTGEKAIAGSFWCNELEDVKGMFHIKKKVNEPDGKYGPNATTPDLAAVDFKIMKSAFLQRLECSTEQIQEIEAATRLQGEDDGSWSAVRRDRITASWAGTIAKRRTKIVTPLVQKLLYAPSKVTKAMIYGHTFEPVAAKKFEESTRFKVERCGFFVHYDHGFIGASPDYLVIMPCGKRALLEINIIMDGILSIEGVEWCIEDNGDAHHTWDYYYMEKGENSRLVVRRGQSFLLLLKTDRKYDIETDVIVIVTTVQDAQQPSISHGTQVIIPLEFQGNNALAGPWKGEMLDSSDNNMLIR
ncbi:hypothetical protein QYM36_010360, partial [Artemia franciscana]